MRAARHRMKGLVALVLATLALGGVFAHAAFAETTPEPTLGLTALEAKLEASPTHSIPGYFKTVLQGSTISTIPCTVLAITGDEDPASSLILFKASGAAMDDIGGIAHGMSGSPIYVQDDDSTWKIIGAVSYGDEFTIGNTGLATPIESMLDLMNTYAPRVEPLSTPVISDGRTIDRVIVAPDPQDFSAAEKTGALVAKPLADTLFIGGVRSDTAAYKKLASLFAKKGYTLTARTSPGAGTSSLDTTLTPGSSIGDFESIGDLWMGSLGTVTYTDDDQVLAFGHPATWMGATSMFMTNAYVDGIWPSADAPYKLMRPATLKGTVTQDRSAGILGTTGSFPDETTITARAYSADTGKTATSSVEFVRALFDNGTIPAYAFEIAGYVAAERLTDVQAYAGSADVTTTAVFGNANQTYTVTIPNIVDSSDLVYRVGDDAWLIAQAIADLPASAGPVELYSVDVNVHMTSTRRGAQIIGIDAPQGLKHGDNPVKVSLMVTRSVDPTTIDGTVTIPADAPLPLSGSIMAVGNGSDYYRSIEGTSASDLASETAALEPNDVVDLAYVRSSDMSGYLYSADSSETTVATPWDVTGSARAHTPHLYTYAPTSVAYGGRAYVIGMFSDSSVPDTVAVYASSPDHPAEQLLGVATLGAPGSPSAAGLFTFVTPPLAENTVLHVHSDPVFSDGYYSDGLTSGDSYVYVKVRPNVRLSASSKTPKSGSTISLSLSSAPVATAGGAVTFEWTTVNGKSWHKIATKSLTVSGSSCRAATGWKVPKGARRVRARFLGTSRFGAVISNTMTITGK